MDTLAVSIFFSPPPSSGSHFKKKERGEKWQHQEELLRPISRKKNFSGRANVEKTSGVRSNGCRRTLIWTAGGGHYASVAKKHALIF